MSSAINLIKGSNSTVSNRPTFEAGELTSGMSLHVQTNTCSQSHTGCAVLSIALLFKNSK